MQNFKISIFGYPADDKQTRVHVYHNCKLPKYYNHSSLLNRFSHRTQNTNVALNFAPRKSPTGRINSIVQESRKLQKQL